VRLGYRLVLRLLLNSSSFDRETNMSSRLQRVLPISTKLLWWVVNLLLLAATTASIAAHAQDSWQIDPKHSVATLSLGSGANQLQIGLARVSGEVIFESSDPGDPIVTLKIVGDAREADYASMSFSSKRSAIRSDGKLTVTGDLSVTRVERSVTMEPNEAYAGGQYGEPVARTTTRQITLIFSDPRQVPFQNGAMHFSGRSTVGREDFPDLLDAIALDDWPSQLINDEKCENPATIGEDYHGPKCTGTVIASVTNPTFPRGNPGAEDFSGFEPTVIPDRNKATIALDLKLTPMSASSVAFK
jgi:polyisoprenoid-binding protein YceI